MGLQPLAVTGLSYTCGLAMVGGGTDLPPVWHIPYRRQRNYTVSPLMDSNGSYFIVGSTRSIEATEFGGLNDAFCFDFSART